MEDFGDFLYIIFAIIGIAYSVMKKNGKKASEATPPVFEDDDVEETFELDERTYENTHRPTELVEQPERTSYSQPVQSRPIDNAMEEKKRQMERNFSRIKRTGEINKPVKEEAVEETGFLAEFDLRQAVIYSELLKRPEF